MNLRAETAIEYDCALFEPTLSRVADGRLLAIEPLAGGRNSRVYRVDCGGREVYVAKVYPESSAVDERDRRGHEFSALRFMWNHGVRSIPEPFQTHAEKGFSLLAYIEGEPLTADTIGEADVDALVDFLVEIASLETEPASRALGFASEACLSLDSAFEHLRVRLGRLRDASRAFDTPVHQALRDFLDSAIEPAVDSGLAAALTAFRDRGLDGTRELAPHELTLSPSDFGFHNALRRPDGTLAFLDFEHFGWDDPAKMVSDFLLHPALPIDTDLRTRFFERMLERHPQRDAIAWRVPVVYPLHALKWCTILLNEFVAEHRLRRSHAEHLVGPDEAVLGRQLDRARAIFEFARHAKEHFPHAA